MSVNTAPFTVQALRYGLVGAANTGVGLLVILCLYKIVGLPLLLSNILGYGAGIALSFFLNRSWTFGHDGHLGHAAASYGGLVGLAFVVSYAVLHGLMVADTPYVVAQCVGVLTYSVLVFLGARSVVFADE